MTAEERVGAIVAHERSMNRKPTSDFIETLRCIQRDSVMGPASDHTFHIDGVRLYWDNRRTVLVLRSGAITN